MSTTTRWTSADLEALPDDGTRYEIIDGELFMSKQPHVYHQSACTRVSFELELWNGRANSGQVIYAPGLIFADDNDVVPDVVWLSNETLAISLGGDGKLHTAPELAVEVLSPGKSNERRDRDAKLNLYSRRGVSEYWILSWQKRQIDVYRRVNGQLRLEATLSESDILESPLLPGFSCAVALLLPRKAIPEAEV
jgi:Uma2 family endonuclease